MRMRFYDSGTSYGFLQLFYTQIINNDTFPYVHFILSTFKL